MNDGFFPGSDLELHCVLSEWVLDAYEGAVFPLNAVSQLARETFVAEFAPPHVEEIRFRGTERWVTGMERIRWQFSREFDLDPPMFIISDAEQEWPRRSLVLFYSKVSGREGKRFCRETFVKIEDLDSWGSRAEELCGHFRSGEGGYESCDEEQDAAHEESTFCYVRDDGSYKVCGFADGSMAYFDYEDHKWSTVSFREGVLEDESGKWLAKLENGEPVYWTRYEVS
jgi:hypothetical protein